MEVFKKVFPHVAFAPEKMKKVNLFDTEQMFCDVYCFEPGQEQAAHVHKGSDKIYYLLQGKGLIRVGQEEKNLDEGSIAIAPSGSEHGVKNLGPDRLVLLVFMAPKP
jgi:quercetin dioxygenase-like cupin family protein